MFVAANIAQSDSRGGAEVRAPASDFDADRYNMNPPAIKIEGGGCGGGDMGPEESYMYPFWYRKPVERLNQTVRRISCESEDSGSLPKQFLFDT